MSALRNAPRRALQGLLGGLLLMSGLAHAGTVTYVYTDPQGTPLAEADTSGNITATFDYAPYGSQALGTPPSGPGYTGHVNDPESGLVYMQARYYDPAVGRFISTDPIGPAAGNAFNFNRYAYADNSPIVHDDPTGAYSHPVSDDQRDIAHGHSDTGIEGEDAQDDGDAGLTNRGGDSMAVSANGGTVPANGGTDLQLDSEHKEPEPQNETRSEQKKIAATAALEEAKALSERGLLDKLKPAGLAEMIEVAGVGVHASETAVNYGKTFGGLLGITYQDAIDDIEFCRNSETVPPSGRYYPGSWINWGKVDWRPFGIDKSQSSHMVLLNALHGIAQLPEYKK